MQISALLSSALLTLWALILHSGGHGTALKQLRNSATSYAVITLPTLGRCSGNANCSACSTCEYCGHCAGGGGTCGVCASSSYSAPIEILTRRQSYRGIQTHSSTAWSRAGYPISSPFTASKTLSAYIVKGIFLNLRAQPSLEAAVVAVLSRGEMVTVVKVLNQKWARVQVITIQGEKTGYVLQAYLLRIM